MGDKEFEKKFDKQSKEVLCLVAWWPSPNDPAMLPLNTEIPYTEVRREAPKLLVEYFLKRMIFVWTSFSQYNRARKQAN